MIAGGVSDLAPVPCPALPCPAPVGLDWKFGFWLVASLPTPLQALVWSEPEKEEGGLLCGHTLAGVF